jgi:hypothetical protein
LRDEANRPRTDEPRSGGQLRAQRTGIAGDDRSDSTSKRGSLSRENLVNTGHSCSSVETVRDWFSGQICTPGPLMLAGTQPRRSVKSYRVAILAASCPPRRFLDPRRMKPGVGWDPAPALRSVRSWCCEPGS